MKKLNFVKIAEIIIKKNLPLCYFSFSKKKGYTDVKGMFYQGQGKTMEEYSTTTLRDLSGFSKSTVITSFQKGPEMPIPLLIVFLAYCNENNFVIYYNFFNKIFDGIKINYIIEYYYIENDIREKAMISFTNFSYKKLEKWLEDLKKSIVDAKLSKKEVPGKKYLDALSNNEKWDNSIEDVKKRINNSK